MSRIVDFMSTTFISLSPAACILEATRQMKASGTGIVLLCSNGKLRGVITESDIVNVVAEGKDTASTPASSAMSHHPLISPGASVVEAAGLMAKRGVRVLPVVQNGNPVGLLSLGNLPASAQTMAAMVLDKAMSIPDQSSNSVWQIHVENTNFRKEVKYAKS